jgi:hypothetical protein
MRESGEGLVRLDTRPSTLRGSVSTKKQAVVKAKKLQPARPKSNRKPPAV